MQLTYHTFNPKARDGRAVRYPEIPQLMGVDISPDEAALLGVKASASTKAQSRADALMSRYWMLWRERDALDRRFFGGKPQDLLSQRPAAASTLTSLPDDAANEASGFASFDELSPVQRMVAITRYTENVVVPHRSERHRRAVPPPARRDASSARQEGGLLHVAAQPHARRGLRAHRSQGVRGQRRGAALVLSRAPASRSSTTTRATRSSPRVSSPTSATPPTRVAGPSGRCSTVTRGGTWGRSSRDLR